MTGGTPSDWDKRLAIVDACRRMNELGINQGRSGNISCRMANGLLVTPSGLDYDALRPEDIVSLDMEGGAPDGQLKPSSEWRFHCDILRARPEIGAVVHTHAMFATVLACHRREIPAFHYMVAVAGGDSIRCAPYATFGTQQLSYYAIDALMGRKACLLANHGVLVMGSDLRGALNLAIEVETLAAQYSEALRTGEPVLLTDAEMAEVLERFKNYGPRPKATRWGQDSRI